MTKPTNVQDTSLFVALFKKLLEHCTFEIQAFMGDVAYDSKDNLKFVIDELHALPRVARNPLWEKRREPKVSCSGGRICIAGFEMLYWGRFTDRGKIRKKFVCPITHSKKIFPARSHLSLEPSRLQERQRLCRLSQRRYGDQKRDRFWVTDFQRTVR